MPVFRQHFALRSGVPPLRSFLFPKMVQKQLGYQNQVWQNRTFNNAMLPVGLSASQRLVFVLFTLSVKPIDALSQCLYHSKHSMYMTKIGNYICIYKVGLLIDAGRGYCERRGSNYKSSHNTLSVQRPRNARRPI